MDLKGIFQRNKRSFAVAGSAALIVALSATGALIVHAARHAKPALAATIAVPAESPAAPALSIRGESAESLWVSADGSEQKVLFSKNPDEPLLIASLTKLMTADLVLENYKLDAPVTVSDTAINQGGSFQAGQTVAVKTLLSAMMIDSDNSAAYALSEKMGAGNFVMLMNQKAQALGLTNTIYYNAVGFGRKNHSTANDLAKLVAWILKDEPSVFPISVTPSYEVRDVGGAFLFEARNTDTLVGDKTLAWADRIVGNKTGKNDDAGECLALVVKAPSGDGYIITIVLKSPDRFSDMKGIVDWDDSSYDWKS